MGDKSEQIQLSTNSNVLDLDDQYDHHDLSIEYIVENVLYEPSNPLEKDSKEFKTLEDLFNSFYTNGCNCINLSSDCSNVSDNNCFHGGNYIETQVISSSKKMLATELILNPNRKSKDLIYECFQQCTCSVKARKCCKNRRLQYGPRKNLKIINSYQIQNQKGLITTEFIPCGGFICEYVGELLTKTEAERRHINNIRVGNQMNYVICLNEHCIDQPSSCPNKSKITSKALQKQKIIEEFKGRKSENKQNNSDDDVNIDDNNIDNDVFQQTFIDPSKKGNIGRYLNHSCDPNCEILSVRVDGPIPKLGIFAKKDIKPYEELYFHYADGCNQNNDKLMSMNYQKDYDKNNRIPCYCGSKICQKYLPNIKY